MRHTKRGKVIRRTKRVYCIAYVFIFCFRYELWRETRLHICIENLAIRIVHWFLNRFYLSLSYSNLWGSFAFKHHFSSVILADDYCAKRILFSIISRDRFSSVHFSLSMVHAIVGRTLNEVWKNANQTVWHWHGNHDDYRKSRFVRMDQCVISQTLVEFCGDANVQW